MEKDQQWVEDHQDDICKYCEMFIIEGSSNSQHFQCEGSYCEEATEKYVEGLDEDEEVIEKPEVDLEELQGIIDDILTNNLEEQE